MSIMIDELNRLNKRFHCKEMVTEEFYNQLINFGLIISKCFLVKLIEEGSNTYFGIIISQTGNFIEFDIDLDNAQYSTFEDITENVLTKIKSPKSVEMVAYKIFKEML